MNLVEKLSNKLGRILLFKIDSPRATELYLKLLYKRVMDKNLDLKNPRTFNEKMQWLKIHDRKQIYTTMVDKYEAKKYVASIIGEEYIIPTLGGVGQI